jgi:hypothetical protein
VRKAVLFTAGGAAVVLAAAAVMRFAVVPSLLQLPANLDSTVRFTGTATLLDPAALSSGDVTAAFKSNVPVTAEQRLRMLSTSGRTAVVSDEFTLAGATSSSTKHIWAVDRKQLDAVVAPAGSNAQHHEGLVVGFPLQPEPHDYAYWDTPTQSKVMAKYQRAEQHAGRDTYVYTVHAAGPFKDTALASGLPATLSKATLLAFASLLPPTVRDGFTQNAAFLPEQLPITYASTGDSTFWVDTSTGYVVDVNQKQTVNASLSIAGQTIPLATVFAVDLKFTPETVAAVSKDAADGAAGLNLLGTIVPVVLLGLGVLLAIVAVLVGVLRRRRPAPPAPAPAPVSVEV